MDKKKIDSSQPIFVKAFVNEISKDAGESGILGECVITSSVVDRGNDILTADGWDFTAFEKNPVMLWSHNSGFDENRPSIGRILSIRQVGNKWLFTPQFDMEDEFARMIFSKFQRKFLNAFSIGFIAREYEERKEEYGYVITKKEALEFSAVNVPANPEALVQRDVNDKLNYSKSWSEWSKGIHIPTKTKEELCKIHSEEKGVVCPLQDEKSIFYLESLKSEKGNYDFDKVKQSMINLMGVKGEELSIEQWKTIHVKLAEIYDKTFSRIAPEREHFVQAMMKVAEGKTKEEKKKIESRKVKIYSKKAKLAKALNILAKGLNIPEGKEVKK